MTKPILIISAVQFEANPLLQALDNEEINYDYFELGIGPLHAAYKAHKLAELCRERKVLYLGTCGSFASFTKPYLVQAKETLWMPTGVRTGQSHAVDKWYPAITLKENSEIDLAAKTILTSPELSLTNAICEKFNKYLNDDLYENMELYAVAKSLQNSKELNIVLAVTNQVGPEGHEQWKTHFKCAAELTRDFVLSQKAILL